MTKSTLTLTQSGLLAVLLEHQRREVRRRARRRAQREHLRSMFCNTLTGPFRALAVRMLTGDSAKPSEPSLPHHTSIIDQTFAMASPIPFNPEIHQLTHYHPSVL